MKDYVGYFNGVGCGESYGLLRLTVSGATDDIRKANFAVYVLHGIVYVVSLKDGEEKDIVAISSNFSLYYIKI